MAVTHHCRHEPRRKCGSQKLHSNKKENTFHSVCLLCQALEKGQEQDRKCPWLRTFLRLKGNQKTDGVRVWETESHAQPGSAMAPRGLLFSGASGTDGNPERQSQVGSHPSRAHWTPEEVNQSRVSSEATQRTAYFNSRDINWHLI